MTWRGHPTYRKLRLKEITKKLDTPGIEFVTIIPNPQKKPREITQIIHDKSKNCVY